MRVTIEELRKQRDAELRAERRMIFERQLAFQKEAAENAQRMNTMQLDSTHKLEIIRLEFERQKAESENEWLRAQEAKRQQEGCSVM